MSEMIQPRRGVFDRLESVADAVEAWGKAHGRIVRIAGEAARVTWAFVALLTSALLNGTLLWALGVSAVTASMSAALLTLGLLGLVFGERWRSALAHGVLLFSSVAVVALAPAVAELAAAEVSTWVGAIDLPDPAVAGIVRPLVGIATVLTCWGVWRACSRQPVEIATNDTALWPLAALIDHDEDGLLRVARHEAAHALVAHRLGLDVEKITTRPSNGNGGYVRYRQVLHTSADQTWARCVDALAGHSVDLEHEHHDFRSNSDIATALSEAINLASIGTRPADYDGSITVTAIIDAATARARQILDADAAVLGSLTARLIEVREVEFDGSGDLGRWLDEDGAQ